MRYLLVFFSIILMMVGCAKPIYIPTEAKTIIEYRDTTIYIKDTVRVEVPTEQAEHKQPSIEPSHLETSVATSDAWVENDKLHHTLKNKKTTLKAKVDTVFTVTYVDRYIEKPIIKEVEVPVKYIPKIVWFCIGWTILCIGWFLAKIVIKLKGL